MHLFISAGEPSGDLHGANLIRAIKKLAPDTTFIGFGGDKMEAAGCKLIYPLTKHAVMWFLRVFTNILTFLRLLKQAKNYFHQHKPDAVIVIDYPGFHFEIAKRAHAAGIPVYYFVPPQLWAWAGWRVKKMRWWMKKLLSALPFEHEWYLERGVDSTYVGHPYFDELSQQKLDETFLQAQREKPGKIIGILPGSRMQEVTRNLSEMFRAAQRIHAQHPETRFLVASYNDAQAEVAKKLAQNLNLPIEIHVKRTKEIIALAEACISVSGSVSLEMMFQGTPAVIVYRLNWASLRIGRFFMKCKYITLVNLLANKELYPEFLTDRDPSTEVANRILHWLNNPEVARQLREELRQLRERVAHPGACDRAAQVVVTDLQQLPQLAKAA